MIALIDAVLAKNRPQFLLGIKQLELPGHRVVVDGADAAPERVDLVIGYPKSLTAEKLLALLERGLTYVVLPMAGVAQPFRELLLSDARFAPLQLYSFHHNCVATAEMAVALLLAAARRVVQGDVALRRGLWRRQPAHVFSLRGETALVLGYGKIGQQVCRVLAALGMKLLAVRRSAAAATVGADGVLRGAVDELIPGFASVEVFPPSALHALLPRCRAMVLALPDTGESRGLVGAEELALLPSGPSCVVNVGRYTAIDEAAMWEHLQKPGTSFGSDVWSQEVPLGASAAVNDEPLRVTQVEEHQFEQLENVVLSPHCAGGMGIDSVEDSRAEFFENLLNTLGTDDAPRAVDLHSGY